MIERTSRDKPSFRIRTGHHSRSVGRSCWRGSIAGEDDEVLVIEDLKLGYGDTVVLELEHLSLLRGEVLAIVGRSGCGKTTLLSCLSGDLRTWGGSYHVGGRYFGDGLPDTYVSRTLQNFPLFHWLTVRQNLALAARIRGVKVADLELVLRQFSAEKLADRYPQNLSGGERCRASLCQATIAGPSLLLLDEPFGGLDTLVKEAVAESLFDFADTNSVAVIFVTHDLHDAVEYADRVVALGGRRFTHVLGEVPSDASGAVEALRNLLAGDGQ